MFKSNYNNEYTIKYKIIHIILGGILGIENIYNSCRIVLFLLILIYQYGQFIFNVRYFFHKNKIVGGNCIYHTTNKLLDYLYGYLIVFFIYNFFRILN